MDYPTYQKYSIKKMAVPVVVRNIGNKTLSNPTVSVSPSGMTATITLNSDEKGYVVLCVGGTADANYLVTANCDVSNGETAPAKFMVQVRD